MRTSSLSSLVKCSWTSQTCGISSSVVGRDPDVMCAPSEDREEDVQDDDGEKGPLRELLIRFGNERRPPDEPRHDASGADEEDEKEEAHGLPTWSVTR